MDKAVKSMLNQAERIKEVDNFFNRENTFNLLRSVMGFVMRTPKLPDLALNIGGGSYTDGKRTVVGLPLELINEDYEDIYMALIYLIGHESQHNVSSSFDDFSNYNDKVSKTLIDKGINRGLAQKVTHSVGNILEDGRVDRILLSNNPGIKGKMDYFNMFFWDKLELGENSLIDMLNTLNVYASLEILPKNYEKVYADTDFDKLFQEIKPALEKGVVSYSCSDGLYYAEEIVNLMIDFIKKESDKIEEGDTIDLEELLKELEDFVEEISTQFSEEIFNETDSAEESDHKEEDEKTKEEKIEEIMENIKETKEDVKEETKNAKKKDDKEEDRKNEEKREITREDLDELFNGSETVVDYEYFSDYPQRHSLPPKYKIEGKKLRKEIEKIFKNKNSFIRNQNTGVLDTENLHRAAMGDRNIFIQEEVKSQTDIVVYILQDLSGSMADGKYEESFTALSVLEEGLKSLIPMKSVAFNVDYAETERRSSNALKVYHRLINDFGDTSTKTNNAYSFLRSSFPAGANHDGFSIKVATNELMQRGERDKILIILSDGMPISIEETKDAVKEAKRKGIHVVSIFFGNKRFRKDNRENYINMYQNNIVSCDPKLISKKLIKTFRDIIER